MFKVLVLQSVYGLSDAQAEFQIRDRLSFMRFLKLGFNGSIPDEKTIWFFRERVITAGAFQKLFARFGRYLEQKGFAARTGSLMDASIVEVPKQRNTREENTEIKEGRVPEAWKEDPAKLRQKDVEARWIQKHGKTSYGYKNHINADAEHKLVRQFEVTPASVHDIHCFKTLLDPKNPDKKVWADKAYRSEENESFLKKKGYSSRIHHRASRAGFLSETKERLNRRYSKIRARVEHVFGFLTNSMQAKWIRGVGLKRATFKIGMNNLVYNFCRYKQLRATCA